MPKAESHALEMDALMSAIVAIIEDAHELAVVKLPPEGDALRERIALLLLAGRDITTLAAAVEVIERRGITATG